jgi:pimeloyl-ACP methyl ester carboxylesterase
MNGEAASFVSRTVESNDGTIIGYREIGRGPGVIVIHGGGAMSLYFTELATALADAYSVYLPDRRGRGLSTAATSERGVASEIEDIQAVMQETNTTYVMGVSAGAVVALQTARAIPTIARLALFEPPLSVGGHSSTAWVPRYERELAKGKRGAAIATIVKATEGVRAPHIVLAAAMGVMLRRGDARARRAGAPPISDLVAAMRDDIRIVKESEGPLDRFASIQCEVLLLGGAKSPAYLEAALHGLEAVLPNVRRVTLPGVGHRAANNGGRPDLVAAELRTFFDGRA